MLAKHFGFVYSQALPLYTRVPFSCNAFPWPQTKRGRGEVPPCSFCPLTPLTSEQRARAGLSSSLKSFDGPSRPVATLSPEAQ